MFKRHVSRRSASATLTPFIAAVPGRHRDEVMSGHEASSSTGPTAAKRPFELNRHDVPSQGHGLRGPA